VQRELSVSSVSSTSKVLKSTEVVTMPGGHLTNVCRSPARLPTAGGLAPTNLVR
jgi:hypothetical protein